MIHLQVPFLEESELEDQARGLLHRFAQWAGSDPKPPIDIERIIEGHLKLAFEITDLKGKLGYDDVLGAAWFEEGRVAVDSSLEREEGRLAFTLGHEVGHWILHRPLYEQQKKLVDFTRSGDEAAVVCRLKDRQGQLEWQANQFSSRVLMPSRFVREAAEAAFGNKVPSWAGLRSRYNRDEYDPELKRAAGRVILEGGFSNISNEAMRRRLVDLRLVQDSAEVQPTLFG